MKVGFRHRAELQHVSAALVDEFDHLIAELQRLRPGAALTAASTAVANSGDATTDALINNLRTRVNELEARLQALTLLS